MSDFERWQEVKAIVQAALDLPDEERASYLDVACANDEALRREVEALLAVSSTRADLFDKYQVLPPSLRRADLAEGDIAGHYRIIRLLGEGGMGRVYLAEDTEVSRRVALKILPWRLTQEQELHARLQHQNIAVFFDSGTTQDGFGYFAMEYIEGEPITTYCERKGLNTEERLVLFLQVCDAVAFAHRNLVVHRDIKPSNILIAPDGKPKLLDFGIAKALPADAELLTVTRPDERSLTLAFASPEQLEGERTTIATDIYSLGVLLCLLLTGRLPYGVKSYHDLPWAIRNMEPEKASSLVMTEPPQGDLGTGSHTTRKPKDNSSRKLARMLSGDLDAIMLRALRKEPDKRYQTVGELAADIRHFLSDEPVSACKGNTQYRLAKFAKRHSVAVPISVIALLIFLGLLCGLYYQWRQTSRQRDVARQQAELAEETTRFLVNLFDRSSAWPATGVTRTPEQFVDEATSHLAKDLLSQPRLRARLLNTLAEIHIRLGSYQKAESLLQDALTTQEASLGAKHADVGETLNALAALRQYQGKFEEAEALYVKSIGIARQHARENPAALASRLSNLSSLKGRQSPVEAERLAREALAICEAHPETTRKHLDNVLRHLSRALEHQDRYDEAEAALRRAIRIIIDDSGPSHPNTAMALDDLGGIFHDEGDHAEEERVRRKALRIMEAAVPADNPQRVTVMGNLAGALTHLGRLEEAENLHRKVLESRLRVLGEKHPLTAVAVNNLAHNLLNQDGERLPEAEDLFRQAIPLMERAYGPDSRELAIGLNNLAMTLTRLQQYDEAERLFTKAVRLSIRAFGDPSVDTALTLRDYGYLKLKQDHFTAAQELLERALSTLRAKLPEDHAEVAFTEVLLGASRAGLGHFAEGERLILKGYQVLQHKEPRKSRKIRATLECLIALYRAWGNTDEAERYQKLLTREG